MSENKQKVVVVRYPNKNLRTYNLSLFKNHYPGIIMLKIHDCSVLIEKADTVSWSEIERKCRLDISNDE